MRYLIVVAVLYYFSALVGMDIPEKILQKKDEILQKQFLGRVVWALKNKQLAHFKDFITEGDEFPKSQMVALLALDASTWVDYIPMLFTRCPIKENSIKLHAPLSLKELACRSLFKHNSDVFFSSTMPRDLRDYLFTIVPKDQKPSEYPILARFMKRSIVAYPHEITQAGFAMAKNYSIAHGIALLKQMAALLPRSEKDALIRALRKDKVQLHSYQQLLYSMTNLTLDRQCEIAQKYKEELIAVNRGAIDMVFVKIVRAVVELCMNPVGNDQAFYDLLFQGPKECRMHCLEDIIEDFQM